MWKDDWLDAINDKDSVIHTISTQLIFLLLLLFGNASYANVDKVVEQDNAIGQNADTFVDAAKNVDETDDDHPFILTGSQQLKPSYLVVSLAVLQPFILVGSVVSSGIRIRAPPLSFS